MLCFEVLLNGKKLCLAGVGESGVLSTIVGWVGGSTHSPRKRGRTRAGQAYLHVGGGLSDREPDDHVYSLWVHRDLQPGDEVSIRLVRATSPDEPKESTIQTDDEKREQQRQYYLRLKDQFEGQHSGASADDPSASRRKRKPTGRRPAK